MIDSECRGHRLVATQLRVILNSSEGRIVSVVFIGQGWVSKFGRPFASVATRMNSIYICTSRIHSIILRKSSCLLLCFLLPSWASYIGRESFFTALHSFPVTTHQAWDAETSCRFCGPADRSEPNIPTLYRSFELRKNLGHDINILQLARTLTSSILLHTLCICSNTLT